MRAPVAPEVGYVPLTQSEDELLPWRFVWVLPFDIEAVAVTISEQPDSQPYTADDAIFDPAIEEYTVEEGVTGRYINIAYKNTAGWGPATSVEIPDFIQNEFYGITRSGDVTPPDVFTVRVEYVGPDRKVALFFSTEDAESGMSHFEVAINDNPPTRVTVEDGLTGYVPTRLDVGTYSAQVVAIDKAGNARAVHVPLLVTRYGNY